MTIYFLQKDILSNVAYCIVSASKNLPLGLDLIFRQCDDWMNGNPIAKPSVSVPDFILFKANGADFRGYIHRMIESIPSLKALFEGSGSLDPEGFSRDILNRLEKEKRELDEIRNSCSPQIIKTTKDVDTTTKEGKMLMMAIAAITSSSAVSMNGKVFNGLKMSFEMVAEELNETIARVYGATIQVPAENILSKD